EQRKIQPHRNRGFACLLQQRRIGFELRAIAPLFLTKERFAIRSLVRACLVIDDPTAAGLVNKCAVDAPGFEAVADNACQRPFALGTIVRGKYPAPALATENVFEG